MKNEKGFTLVELMIGLIIFPMIFMSTYLVLTSANVIFQSTNAYAQLNMDGMQLIRSMGREIGQSSPATSPSHLNLSTGGGNTTARFQIPVDWDNDGDADTGGLTPSVEWGIYDQVAQLSSGRLDGWGRYSVTGTQLIRDVLDASLNPVAGLSKVIANNVQTFTVTQNQETLTITLALQNNDNQGQSGKARTFRQTFTAKESLRNDVA